MSNQKSSVEARLDTAASEEDQSPFPLPALSLGESSLGRLGRRWAATHPVLSLSVQAAAVQEKKQRSQFSVLTRHIFSRFFENDLIASADAVQARLAQAAAAVAFPGVALVMALIPSYHWPVKKAFWPQAADHYFFVVYSFVVLGVLTVFEWDALFPDQLDAFVLTTLPVTAWRLFTARISAMGLLLGAFLFIANVFSSILLCLWFWALTRAEEVYSPGYFGHLGAHIAAVGLSGIFAAGLIVGAQSVILIVLGERAYHALTPLLQSIATALLLILLFLYPLVSHFLAPLLLAGNPAVLWFPPFWFLGIYETLLAGHSAQPVFFLLARNAGLALLAVSVLVAVSYPLAYRRKMRRAIEGAPAKQSAGSVGVWFAALRNRLLLRSPAKRAVYCFISQTLGRVERLRLYLAMYGGLGLSLAVAGAVTLRLHAERVELTLSSYGLLCTVPMIAFWTASGLRTALTSSIDRRPSWIFRAIHGQPAWDHLLGVRLWVLLRALAFTSIAIVMLWILAPTQLNSIKAVAAQCIAGFGLCVLLVDLFFVNVVMIPFTAPRVRSSLHLAFLLPAYLLLFPWIVESTVRNERWLAGSVFHLSLTVVLIGALAYGLQSIHRRRFEEEARLLPIEDEDAWPPRLGLD